MAIMSQNATKAQPQRLEPSPDQFDVQQNRTPFSEKALHNGSDDGEAITPIPPESKGAQTPSGIESEDANEICPVSTEPTPGDSCVDVCKASSGGALSAANTHKEEDEEESFEARLERLGRQRPEQFKTIWAEVGFVFSVSMSQLLTEYFVSGFYVILPPIAKSLNIPVNETTWPASSFSLVVSSFLLAFGRLADMHGGYPVYMLGNAWLLIWTVIAGFSTNAVMMNVCRALQGFGPAAYLPSGLMLMGSIYRPGPRKNLVFSIYGAAAPFGFYVGIFFAGISGQYTRWGVYFWIGAALVAITLVVAVLTVPSDRNERKGMGVKMDWSGAILIVVGLVLVVFAFTDSSHAHQGWKTPYILVTFILGMLILGGAVYVEGWIAEAPLLPADLFKVPRMKALILALLPTYGSLGIFLLYATFYMGNIMSASPLQLVAWFTPMALGGCIISTVGGFVLHLIPGTLLLLIAGTAWIAAPLLFALAPEGANFWAFVFPAMICATVAIDVTFNIANVFITTSLPRRQQGLAGAMINSLLHLGIAFFLGIADIVSSLSAKKAASQGHTEFEVEKRSYKATFWFEVGCAVFALVVLAGFVKIEKAESGMTADEKEELAAELERVTTREAATRAAAAGGGDGVAVVATKSG